MTRERQVTTKTLSVRESANPLFFNNSIEISGVLIQTALALFGRFAQARRVPLQKQYVTLV